MQITVVGSADLPELLPLIRAYCDFHQVAPGDQALLELSQALLAGPRREGLQLLARDDTGRAVGFATLFPSASTRWRSASAAGSSSAERVQPATAPGGSGWTS